MSVDVDLKKKCAILTIKWCKVNMGVNKRRKQQLKISVRIRFKHKDDLKYYGVYYPDENRIIVYSKNCLTLEKVVETIIHEYTHYLQSSKKYFDFSKTHTYDDHPYEKEANKNQTKHTKVCFNEIKALIQ